MGYQMGYFVKLRTNAEELDGAEIARFSTVFPFSMETARWPKSVSLARLFLPTRSHLETNDLPVSARATRG